MHLNINIIKIIFFLQALVSTVKTSIEMELETCRNERDNLISNNVKLVKLQMDNFTKLKETLQELTVSALETAKTRQSTLEEKRTSIQTLKREHTFKLNILSKKFDCISNNFTIENCLNFCEHPYAVDSCTEESAQQAQKLYLGRIMLQHKLNSNNLLRQIYLKDRNETHYEVCQRVHIADWAD
jgi:hypothetical protein